MDCGSVESVGGPFWSCTSFFAFGLGVWGCGSGGAREGSSGCLVEASGG